MYSSAQIRHKSNQRSSTYNVVFLAPIEITGCSKLASLDSNLRPECFQHPKLTSAFQKGCHYLQLNAEPIFNTRQTKKVFPWKIRTKWTLTHPPRNLPIHVNRALRWQSLSKQNFCVTPRQCFEQFFFSKSVVLTQVIWTLVVSLDPVDTSSRHRYVQMTNQTAEIMQVVQEIFWSGCQNVRQGARCNIFLCKYKSTLIVTAFLDRIRSFPERNLTHISMYLFFLRSLGLRALPVGNLQGVPH